MVKKFLEYYSTKSESLQFIEDLGDDFEDLDFVKFHITKIYSTRDLKFLSSSPSPGFFQGYRIDIHLLPTRVFLLPKSLMEFYQKVYQFELRLKSYFDVVETKSPTSFVLLENGKLEDVSKEEEFKSIFNHRMNSMNGTQIKIKYGRINFGYYVKKTDSYLFEYEFPVSNKKSLVNLSLVQRYVDSMFPECHIEAKHYLSNKEHHSDNYGGVIIKFVGIKNDSKS